MSGGRNTKFMDQVRQILLDKSMAESQVAVHNRLLRPSLMALATDAREQEAIEQARQEKMASSGSGNATSQSVPSPVKINPDNPGAGLGADVAKALLGQTDVLGSMQVVEGRSADQSGIDPIRQERIESITSGRQQIGNVGIPILSAIVRGLGGPENFGTLPYSRSTTQIVERPEFRKEQEADVTFLANSYFEAMQGFRDPNSMPMLTAKTLERYTPAERKHMMHIMGRELEALKGQQAQVEFQVGKGLLFEMQKLNIPLDNPRVPQIAMGIARSHNIDEITAYAAELDALYRDTPQYQSDLLAAQLANMKAEADLYGQRLSNAKAAREEDVAVRNAAARGLRVAAGITTDRTLDSAHESWKELGAMKKAGVAVGAGVDFKYNPKLHFTYTSNQMAEFVGGGQVNIIQDQTVIPTDIKQLVNRLRILEGVPVDKHGALTNDPDKVSAFGTDRAQQIAAFGHAEGEEPTVPGDKGLSEFYLVAKAEDGTWRVEPRGGRDHQSFYLLTKAIQFAELANARGQADGVIITDPWEYEGIQGWTEPMVTPAKKTYATPGTFDPLMPSVKPPASTPGPPFTSRPTTPLRSPTERNLRGGWDNKEFMRGLAEARRALFRQMGLGGE